MQMKVYVGCALTNAPQSLRDTITDFKTRLRTEMQVEVLEFIGLGNGTAREVYEYDLGSVRKCAIMIAFADHDSIGLGMEIQEATNLRKPVLCLHHIDRKITRMLIGAHDAGKIQIVPYCTSEDAIGIARRYIAAENIVESPYASIYEAIP